MSERDNKGRFVSGNKGGPGRPSKAREERYTEILLMTCTFADWERIIKKAVEQAKRGNQQARQWLSDHLIGKPSQPIEHSGDLSILVNWDNADSPD